MGLFTIHNSCYSWSLDFLKLKLDSQSRLTIPEFSGYHCMVTYDLDNLMIWKLMKEVSTISKIFLFRVKSKLKGTVNVFFSKLPFTKCSVRFKLLLV